MSDAVVDNLILDLLEWLTKKDRNYEETMDAWRTSCPKLPVWEDANEAGLRAVEKVTARRIVRVTSSGFARLDHRRSNP